VDQKSKILILKSVQTVGINYNKYLSFFFLLLRLFTTIDSKVAMIEMVGLNVIRNVNKKFVKR